MNTQANNRDQFRTQELTSDYDSMNNSLQVAVVCDSKKIRELLSRYLREAGYEVTTFENDRVFWQQVSSDDPPDLLVLNVTSSMVKQGELLPQEYDSLSDFPILALSNPVTNVDQSRYPSAISWLTKPVRRDEFLKHIQASLGVEKNQSAETVSDETSMVTATELEETKTENSRVTEWSAVQMSGDERADVSITNSTRPPEKESVDARFSKLRTQIQELETKIDTLQTAPSQEEELIEFESELSEMSEEVAALGDHVGTLYDRMSALEEQVSHLERNLGGIQNNIDDLNAGLETLTDEQVMLADEVESVTRDQAEVQSVIDDLVQWQQEVSTAFSSLPERE